VHNNSADDVRMSGPQNRFPQYDVESKRERHSPHQRSAKSSGTRRMSSTVSPHVNVDARSHVEWFEDTQNYALRASADSKFRIRYAPAQSLGSPWPMPQVYQPTNVSFRVAAGGLFEFHSVGEQCELLDDAFIRFRLNVFGDENFARHDDQMEIHSVNVTVLKECTHYPYLDMDESCEYLCLDTNESCIYLFLDIVEMTITHSCSRSLQHCFFYGK